MYSHNLSLELEILLTRTNKGKPIPKNPTRKYSGSGRIWVRMFWKNFACSINMSLKASKSNRFVS